MTRYQNHAGFQVSSNKLQVVEVNNINKQFVVENVDEEFYSDFFSFKDKETKLINVLQNTFNEITFRKPLSSNFVSFSLPSTVFNFFDIPFDEALTKGDLTEHINWELSVLKPDLSRDELAVQTIKAEESRLRKEKRIILSVIPKNIINAFSKFCMRNNLILRFIDNEHFASNNLLSLQNQVDPGSVTLSLMIRENYFSIVILEGISPVYFKMCNYKGMNELIVVIKNETDNIFKQFGISHTDLKSFLFGDYFSEPVVDKIREETTLSFETLNPFDNIQISNDVKAKKEPVQRGVLYSSAAGVAYRLV